MALNNMKVKAASRVDAKSAPLYHHGEYTRSDSSALKRQTRTKTMFGLFLPGGGARGAYQVGVLKAISKIIDDDNPFQVIAGTSVGAVNAAGAAEHAANFRKGMQSLVNLWRNLDASKIYVTDYWPVAGRAFHWLSALMSGGHGAGNPISLLDNSPLQKLLEENVDFGAIDAAIQSGALRALAVSVSGYAHGRAETFFQGAEEIEDWTRARRDGIRATLTVDHLMASASLPVLFPAQKIDNQYYGDGSLRLTAPLSSVIRLGADRILVIGVRDKIPDAKPPAAPYPSLGDLAGYMLDIVFNENLDNDVERLCRINKTLESMPLPERNKTNLRRIGVMTISPSQDLRAIAGEHAHALPWTIRALLRGVGAWGGNWRLASFLLFERPFIEALIDLGFQDAMAASSQIETFFTADEPIMCEV